MKLKKFVAGVLAAGMVFSLAAPTTRVVAEQVCVETEQEFSGEFSYSVKEDGTAIITDYAGGGDVVVPGSIDGYVVTEIGGWAFRSNEEITGVVIPASVTTLADEMFKYCYNLNKITIETGNTSYKMVGNALITMDGTLLLAYAPASAPEVYTVPDGVIYIARGAFNNANNLKKVTLPDSVQSIEVDAFSSCDKLESMIIPDGVTVLSASVFDMCDNLQYVVFPRSINELSFTFDPFGPENVVIYYAGSEAEWAAIEKQSFGSDWSIRPVYYNWTVENFVERLYTIALNRESDAVGLINWTNALNDGTHDGAKVAAEFLNGEEFKLRGLSNGDYVDVLYRTFFGREADEEGKNLWVSMLDAGYAREYVLSQFVNLDEFKHLCGTYGIDRGVMFENGVAANPNVTNFVHRLYETVFGREADASGLYSWALELTMKTKSARSVAINFFNSDEYVMKNVDNAAYVSDLYSVFMNRGADSEGLLVWVTALNNGMTRSEVLLKFAGSAEFTMLAAKYGL